MWSTLCRHNANRVNLIMRYLSIQWSDLEIKHTVAIVRFSRSFLWYAMNKLIHVMSEQIDACNAIMIFRVHEWSFQSFSLIKSWVQNQVFTPGNIPWLKVGFHRFLWSLRGLGISPLESHYKIKDSQQLESLPPWLLVLGESLLYLIGKWCPLKIRGPHWNWLKETRKV